VSEYNTSRSSRVAGSSEFIMELSGNFDSGVTDLKTKLNKALENLSGSGIPGAKGSGNSNTSDPVLLAEYQAALSAYTLFCNAQSSSVKAFKDIAAATISNFR